MSLSNNLRQINNDLYQVQMLNHMTAIRYGNNSKQAKRSDAMLRALVFIMVFFFVLVMLLVIL